MPPASREKKPSRITIACNACRSRKQKHGSKLTLFRGPAKGYIEALEHRLHETESVLLKLLSRLSDDQLSSTLSPPKRTSRSNIDLAYTPFSRLGKQDAGFWKKFPLDTPENIREWQRDCLDSEGSDSTGREMNPTGSEIMNSPNLRHLENPSTKRPRLEKDRDAPGSDSELVLSSEIPRPDLYALPLPSEPTTPLSNSSSSNPLVSSRKDMYQPTHVDTGSGGARVHLMLGPLDQSDPNPTESFISSASQEPSFWSEAPPLNFQQKFLW
ncbi:hypothetical protein ASPWEDRAFT_169380 [Aspergillus wentii DTO 134E9]|uniref:Uncharacterized protein n=1 Tax=Aspergillus wentii DTO 134E9 TaxID=1073089 RepID=A0A1L9RXH3_ASPWE|nr:uncharacterized protein ASPWEDRAFT_169380 [Aspergillus wentii DTO 134E9]OJJ39538.1 hypothetical protein ASPWEDRAFT_169380 [Aspergillus wentii DTO 134E9]